MSKFYNWEIWKSGLGERFERLVKYATLPNVVSRMHVVYFFSHNH